MPTAFETDVRLCVQIHTHIYIYIYICVYVCMYNKELDTNLVFIIKSTKRLEWGTLV